MHQHRYTHSTAIAAALMLLAGSTQLFAQGRSIPKGSEARAQEEAENVVDEILPEGQKYRYPLFNGLSLSVDIFDPLLSVTLFDHCSYEVQAMADIHHRFFPMITFGMGEANEKSNNGLDYGTDTKQELLFHSSLSPFGKVGMAYNLAYNDTKPSDYYMLMFRYGIAHNEADITNLYFANDTWGAYGPVAITGQSYTSHWVELGGMIKVQLMRHLSLGWDLYWKVLLHQSGTRLGPPYYVPGMGTTQSSIGFSFRIYYDIF